jgi:hypothetical protein
MSSQLIFPVISILFSLFFLILALLLPDSPTGIGPGGWPSVILGLMLTLSVILLYKTIMSQKQENNSKEVTAEQEHPVPSHSYRHWLVFGLSFLYFFLMQYIGFILATPIYIIVTARILGMQVWLKLIIIALLSSALITYLFAIMLMLPLPRGMGIFRTFSLLFY